MAHSSFGLVFDGSVLFTIPLWTKPRFDYAGPANSARLRLETCNEKDGARKLRMLCRSLCRKEYLGTNMEHHMIIHSGSGPDTPLSFLSLVVGKMWGASWKHCDIAEIGRHKTADILTGSTKELTDHLCCTKTVGVDQWKIDICFPPESGVRGVSGLQEYCN